jgi:hypothetical protein
MVVQEKQTSKNSYQGGIYNRFGSNNANDSLLNLLPGYPHLTNNKQVVKGWVLLIGACVSIFSIFLVLFPYLDVVVATILQWAGKSNIEEIVNYLRFPLAFRLASTFILGLFLLFLFSENSKDYRNKFSNYERDQKPNVFAGSLSGSYIIGFSLVFVILFYGLILNFIPLQKEQALELEMLSPYIDNPPQKKEPKEPPKDAKHVSVQNAVNSGRSDKRLPVSPGVSQPRPQARNRANEQVNKPAPRQPQAQRSQTQPQPSPRPLPPTPYTAPQPKVSKESNRSLLPIFKPKASDERAILSSSEHSTQAPSSTQPISGSPSSSSSSSFTPSAVRAPVLPSRTGGYSQGAGLGNSAPNNNPNGPVTVAARKDVDYGPFMQDLQRRIQQVWKPSSQDNSDQVVVSFTLRKNGSLVPGSLSTLKASNPEAEAAARQAILAASPGFRPLPDGAAEQVRIDFTFTRTGTKFAYKRY